MKALLLAATALLTGASLTANAATAVFGGGCFWCIEADFEKLAGVSDVVSGYSGGKEKNPTYEAVSSHQTSHIEVVQVTYDPAKLSYAALLDYFYRHIDPLTPNAQFCDRGPQYRSAVFYASEAEKTAALAAKVKFSRQLAKPIVTELLPASTFWPAEDYHQNYYKENPLRYNYYRSGCGRDKRIQQIWGSVASKP